MAKEKKGPARAGLSGGLVVGALIFLCNPNMHLIDLLPDAVGYLLLLIALRRLAPADESFRDAAKGFSRLAWLSLARLVALVWVYSSTSPAEQPTTVLCLVFALGVLELIVLFPLCTQLFRGLTYRATRLDGKAVFAPVGAAKIARLQDRRTRAAAAGKSTDRLDGAIRRLSRRRGGDLTDRICFSCQLFALGKTALCVLPEIAGLADAPYREGYIRFNWYAYVGGFRALAFVAGTVIGIVWLVRVLRYYFYVAKDTAFWTALDQYCRADAVAHPARRPARDLKVARLFLVIGFVFVINFYIEGVSYLPGFLTPAAFLVALIALRRYLPCNLTLGAGVLFAVHLLESVVFYIRTARFLDRYFDYDISRDWNVYRDYALTVLRPAIVESVLTLASLAAVGVMLVTLIDRYIRYRETATYLHSAAELARAKVLYQKRWLIVPAVLGVLALAVHLAYYVIWFEHGEAWFQDVLFSGLFLAFAWFRTGAVIEELDTERMAAGLVSAPAAHE